MATYVLIAGSFHGGWSWTRTARLLRDQGHEVHTPSLTGLGERQHLTGPAGIGLETHVDDVLALIGAEELYDIVLVGHSYSGMVAGSVADRAPELFRRVIYLDAFLPEDGKSCLDLMQPKSAEYFLSRATPDDTVAFDSTTLDRWGLVDSADRVWVSRHASPHPLATLTDAARLSRPAGQAGPPPAFIYCTVKPGPDMFAGFAEHARRETRWSYAELDAPHDCMVTHPLETAKLLASLG